jgi:hypothetical protein
MAKKCTAAQKQAKEYKKEIALKLQGRKKK